MQMLNIVPDGQGVDAPALLHSPDLCDEQFQAPPALVPDKEPNAVDAETPDHWVVRHPDFVRLTNEHPLNGEAPMGSSGADTNVPLAPPDLAHVRSHGPVPYITAEEYRMTVVNQHGKETVFDLEALKALPQDEIMATLACASMRRKEMNALKKTKGFNASVGMWHTGIFSGVPLRELLLHCGVEYVKGKEQWVEFQGIEDLAVDKYETCVTLERAMDPAMDIMVCMYHNGEPLRRDHGYPVRIVTPGYVGGRSTKWVGKISIVDKETSSYYHLHDNKVLPPWVDANTPNLEEWLADPITTYWEHPINSAILEPAHNLVASAGSATTLPIKGLTWCGGGRRITGVYVSIDGGKEWRPCSITYPSAPRHGDKYWCMGYWEPLQAITTQDLDKVENPEIVVRACEGANTQPETMTWSLLGYGNNCWYRVKAHKSEKGYKFEHPVTQRSAALDEGWMVEKKTTQAVDTGLKEISMEEIAKHNTPESGWLLINGVVYDVTKFYADNAHPGGRAALAGKMGKDASAAFNAVGHLGATKILKSIAIGRHAVKSKM